MTEYDSGPERMWVWPWQRHRIHLEQEIEYLKTQLAQKQRRIDELQDAILAKAPGKVQYVRYPEGRLQPLQPKGWDAYRYHQKQQPKEEPDAVPSEG